MISEDSSKAHSSRMEDCFMAQTTKTRMSMYNLNLLPDNYVPEDWEEREDRGHCRFSVYDEEGYMVDFKSICKVSDSSAPFIGVRNYYDFVAAVDEFR
jgi:hypothetical protein